MSQLWLNNKVYILPTRAKSNRSQNAMEWGRSNPYQTLLQCKFGQIPVWKREALAVVSRVNSFQASKPCLVGWLVYHVFEDNSCMICSGSYSCLDMHLIISFSCTNFWIRRFEVHLSERSRASPAPHRNFRITQHHCTTLLCRVCLGQRSVDLSLLLLSSLHLHINVMNSKNQNSEWNYDELMMNYVFSIPHSVQLGVST